jgi:phosphoesterase RecJ-like protein
MGYVLYEKMKIYKDKKTAMFAVTRDELNHFRYKSGDTEGFVNMPLSIKGISFSVFMREETNLIKISLRSTGDFPCNKFAAEYFNGGGHKNASGGEYYGTIDEAVKVFEEGLLQFNPNKFEKS